MDGKEFQWSKKEEKFTMFVDNDGDNEEDKDKDTEESVTGSITTNNNCVEDNIYSCEELKKDDDTESDKTKENRNENLSSQRKMFGKGLMIKKRKNW